MASRARLLGFLGGGLALLVVLATSVPAGAVPEPPPSGTPDWFAREAQNLAITQGEAQRENSDPNFRVRLEQQSATNLVAYNQRQAADPDWTAFGNVCETWQGDCAGDPYLYPGVDPFYSTVGKVQRISFYDDGGARIAGTVWAPKNAAPGAGLPAVVMETGSVQAPETLYWWFAESLVRSGYVVMTFDVRGQGMSDNHTPSGAQGGNANSTVFWNGLVDAIDWFRATPLQRYSYNAQWLPSHPLASAQHPNDDFNPYWQLFDHSRLGIVGHSLGATGVSVVQGLDPWPGVVGHGGPNPVGVTVAWDNLAAPPAGSGAPPFKIRTPAMGSSNDYGLVVTPYTSEPDPEGKKSAFTAWENAGVPTYQVVIQGGSHYEYSRIAQNPVPFPTSNWMTWGNPFADYYSLAWLDRWLKQSGEAGYADADQRLLADKDWGTRMSFYFRNARDFTDRQGARHVCQDIRAGCSDTASPFSPPPYVPPLALADNVGPAAALGVVALVAAWRVARRRRPWYGT